MNIPRLARPIASRIRLGELVGLVFGILSMLCGFSVSVRAQNETLPNGDWDTVSALCDPACRDGYSCRSGECVPQCSPACGQGFVCTAEAGCVATEPPAPVTPLPSFRRPASPTQVEMCQPSCRSGFRCSAGRCVSLCNPVCPADERCTAQGECVAWYLFHDTPRPVVSVEPPDPSADSIVNLHMDVAGAFQFGVTPTVEVGERVSGYLKLRVLNTGLLSYFLLGRDRDDTLDFGMGAGLGLHVFSSSQGNMRSWFGGVGLHYIFLQTRDERRDLALYTTHALVPQVDFGYRWALGVWLVGVSATFGLAVPFESSARGLDPGGCAFAASCRRDLSVGFFPGVAVDLGWFVPR